MNKPIGVILYEGPSQLNGKPIVAIATGLSRNSRNPKTGKMIQTYILCQDINPVSANFLFKDKAICGDCKHATHGTCYVMLHQAPFAIYYSYLRGIYPKYNEKEHGYLFKDKHIRLGSFGDPAAIPYSIWENILKLSRNHTGYTHAWQNKKIDPRYKNIIMASCDRVKEYKEAISKGWRTFRIRLYKDSPIFENEFICPAAKEGKKEQDISCYECLNYRGLSCSSIKTPVIVIHGAQNKIDKFRKLIKYLDNKRKTKINIKGFNKAVKELRRKFVNI